MQQRKDFIVFSDDWGRHPFSCQHIMRHFLDDGKILWVNTIGLRTPRLTIYDLKRSLEKIRSWVTPGKMEEHTPLPPNLRVLSPVMIPFGNISAARAFNRRSVVRAVRAAAREWQMENPVLLATLPNAADYTGCFNESLVVYYCVDDFTLWPGMNQPELVRELEDSLLARADLTVAVSDSLCASRGAKSRTPVKLLTHGVDVEHFKKAGSPHPAPGVNLDPEKPVLGFYGLIDSRFDVSLMTQVLKSRPAWQVLCIGTKQISLERLEALPNFRWIPSVPYETLPAYASSFDVAIIPYRVNAHTRTINPLKLREYIATGKPVVTTAMPEVFRFKEHIHIADTPDEFINAVEQALENPVNPESCRAALSGESWKDKAGQLALWMDEALRLKKTTEARA